MEYRTTHGKVLTRIERKKYEKERKKTKGKLIIESVVSGTNSYYLYVVSLMIVMCRCGVVLTTSV